MEELPPALECRFILSSHKVFKKILSYIPNLLPCWSLPNKTLCNLFKGKCVVLFVFAPLRPLPASKKMSGTQTRLIAA